MISFQIADLANEDTPQLYTACGRGPRSTFRVLRHGLEVSKPASGLTVLCYMELPPLVTNVDVNTTLKNDDNFVQ